MSDLSIEPTALWHALGRPAEDFAPYVAEHGESAVIEELLRTVAHLEAEAMKDPECPFDCDSCRG